MIRFNPSVINPQRPTFSGGLKNIFPMTVKAPPNWPFSTDIIARNEFKKARQIEVNCRFWNMLVLLMPRSGYKPTESTQESVASIGCGYGFEFPVLFSYFGRNKKVMKVGETGISNNNMPFLYGIDVDKAALESNNADGIPNCKFICADASQMAEERLIPNNLGVALFKSQQIVNDYRGTWVKMFQQAHELLRKDGIMLITSICDYEHRLAEDCIKKLGFDITVNERNPYRTIGSGGIDHCILIVKK